MISFTRLPSCLLGFGFSTTGHKLEALAHALRIEVFTNRGLAGLVAELHSVCPDFGLESRLNLAMPIPASLLVGNWTDPDGQRQRRLGEVDFSEQEDAVPAARDDMCDFSDEEREGFYLYIYIYI